MTTFDSWESYFYPETIDAEGNGTLCNLRDYRDAEQLRRWEYRETWKREDELRSGAVPVARTYDAEHLRSIHRHLFGRVYEWAGQERTIAISKGPVNFAAGGDIGRHLEEAASIIADTDWARLDQKGFADQTAAVFMHVNIAHPFREGNGRTSKLFMEQVAELSNFRITYDPEVTGITREMWNQQSMYSAFDRSPTPLLPVFYNLAQPAPEGPSASIASTMDPQLAEIMRASFPTQAESAETQSAEDARRHHEQTYLQRTQQHEYPQTPGYER